MAIIAACVLVPLVIVVQQSALARIESDWRAKEAVAGPDGPITPPGFDQFTIATKAFVKMNEAMRAQGQPGPWANDDFASSMLDSYAITLHDEVRLAIVKGELAGTDAALEQLDETAPYVEHGGPLWMDIAALRTLYDRGGDAALTQQQRDALVERHGWYGKVALAFNDAPSDPVRQDLLDGGWLFLWAMVIIMLGLGFGLMAALALFIVALIRIATGQFKLRMEMPSPGGSVYLETFVIFMAAFAALLAFSAQVQDQEGAEWMLILGPWAVAPLVLWPLLRRVPWRTYSADIGWHRGEGIFKEIGCGITGYLASLPGYVAVVIIMVIFEIIRMAATRDFEGTPPPGEFPIDLTGRYRWLMLAGFMSLIAIWAPLVEETIFRGALFRHLTSRLHWLVAAIATAIIFGAIHPYPMLGIVPVAFLGYVFAIMRRWRGSLIAPITAHALHNGTIGAILIVILLTVAD